MERKIKNKPLSALFRNNKFVGVFSVIFAVIIWLTVALTVSPEITVKIEDVPIVIDMENSTPSKLSLEYFTESDEDLTVDVSVVGKRYAVGGLDKDNIKVVAVTSAVDSTGYHTLKLRMDTAADISSFELSRDSISVFFDTRSEAEFTIQAEILADKVIPSDQYMQEKEIISPATVTVSGPTQEVEKIEKIVASVKLDDAISKTTTFNAQTKTKEKEGSAKVNEDFITIGSISEENPAQVTIPVLKKKDLPLSVKFTNVPEYYLNNPLNITVTPNRTTVAAQEDDIDKMTLAYIGTINFSNLNNKVNQFTFKAEDFIDTKPVNGASSYTVKVDASTMNRKKLSLQSTNVEFQNLSDNLTAFLSEKEIENIEVIGPSSTLDQLSSSGLYAEVDMKNISTAGTYVVPARIYAKSVSNCWVYGTYNVNIIVK